MSEAGPHAPYPPAGFATPQTSTSAIVALVLAVLAFAFPVVPAVVGLILARNADEEIAAGFGRVTGAGLARAARVTAWASMAFYAVFFVATLGVVLTNGARL
jgi:hypothetical protein